MRNLRLFLLYCVMSLLMVLPHLILAWPTLPQSALGWLAFLLLPVPFVAVGEWLFQYRQLRVFDQLDALGTYVHRSKYRLAIVIAVLIFAFSLCSLVILSIDVLAR